MKRCSHARLPRCESHGRALPDALKATAIEATHTEALELIAKAFGYENWNILSAKIEAAAPPATAAGVQTDPAPKTLYRSFCGKSQHDVRKLIAGPSVFICDECVDLCTDIVEPDEGKELFQLMTGTEESGRRTYPAVLQLARGMSTEELAYYVERGRKGVVRSRVALQYFQHRLATWNREASAGEDVHMPSLPRLPNEHDTGRPGRDAGKGTTRGEAIRGRCKHCNGRAWRAQAVDGFPTAEIGPVG
jgi:hypothetical protein